MISENPKGDKLNKNKVKLDQISKIRDKEDREIRTLRR